MRAELSCVVIAFTLAGCAVGPRYHVPTAPLPATYKESPADASGGASWKVASPQDGTRRGDWWEIFADPQLNALQEELAANNQNIAQAYQNYTAARALFDQARAQRFPTVTSSLAATRSRSSATTGPATTAGVTAGAVANGRTGDDFLLPVDASWEPDLWGRVRNTVQQYRYAAQVSAADLESVRLSEHSTLAQFFFRLRGQDALQEVLDQAVAADRKMVDYARARYETGVGDRISLVEAQNALQAAEATAAGVRLTRAQYEHAIAVLLGQPPATFSLAAKPLAAVPPEIPGGVPSELLERRSDIAAAERLMAEANAQVGVARAAYFPLVTLSPGAGFQSSSWLQWLNWPSRFWSLGASAAQALFDGGVRRATVAQYTAVYNANVASYRQTVLAAFQQVEDSLAAERILADQAEKQRHAVASAREFLRLASDRYQLGIDSYLNVLTAQATLLSAEQSLVNLETQRMTAVVQLIAALGGGWDRSQLP
jgi:NodT family efflux transporter outer membrane factor (OMF) lipoprotein